MYQTINQTGRNEIRSWLEGVAKKDSQYDSERALQAWASEAEESLAAGNGAHIELRGMHSVSGNPETFVVSDAGIDTMVDFGDDQIDMRAARNLMDDDLCEQIHGTVDNDQEFFDAYLVAHEAKFGASWVFG